MVNKKRLIEKLRRLKRSIKTDPTIMDRYDVDGDKKISADEWDLARQDVISSLESETITSQLHETKEGPQAVSVDIHDTGGKIRSDSSSEYGELRVESFWGAIAMFCLCQVYYFILFEGFVFISGAAFIQRNPWG